MIEENDWRLRGQEDYLKNKKFKLKKFKTAEQNSSHTHCEFCWHKFMENADGIKDCSDEGYCSSQGDYWICKECFEDFKDEFNFITFD